MNDSGGRGFSKKDVFVTVFFAAFAILVFVFYLMQYAPRLKQMLGK